MALRSIRRRYPEVRYTRSFGVWLRPSVCAACPISLVVSGLAFACPASGKMHPHHPHANACFRCSMCPSLPSINLPFSTVSEQKKGAEAPFFHRLSAVPRIPDFTLFCVVVGHVLDAVQFKLFHHVPYPVIRGGVRVGFNGVLVEHHQRAMRRRMTPPAQGNHVHRVMCATPAPWFDVMDLNNVRRVAQGASKAVPFVDLSP